ncbi:hypothetical protein BTVI_49636 [Pitangus sulphuratus]|nr:hypothetical protein BTVI_49636 [Pitangus sulphuratus]
MVDYYCNFHSENNDLTLGERVDNRVFCGIFTGLTEAEEVLEILHTLLIQLQIFQTPMGANENNGDCKAFSDGVSALWYFPSAIKPNFKSSEVIPIYTSLLKMAGVSSCMKYSMFIFNFLFWLCGSIILGVSIWIRVSKDAQQELEIDSSLFAGVDLLIAVGSIIMILGFLGCCGAVKESRCMLLLFFIGLLLILILQVTGGILGAVYRSQAEKVLDEALMSSVKKLQSSTQDSKAFQEKFQKFERENQCCGLLNGPKDWGDNFKNPSGSYEICQCELEKPSQDVCTTFQGRPIYKKPCGEVIVKYIKDHLVIIMGIAFGLAVIECPKLHTIFEETSLQLGISVALRLEDMPSMHPTMSFAIATMNVKTAKVRVVEDMDEDGHLTNGDRDKEEVFNSFFASVFNMDNGPRESHCPELKDHDCKNDQLPVKPEIVQDLLLQLDPYKSMGSDGITKTFSMIFEQPWESG